MAMSRCILVYILNVLIIEVAVGVEVKKIINIRVGVLLFLIEVLLANLSLPIRTKL